MAYQRSLAERKRAFMEDACATCGGGGEEGGSAGEHEPGKEVADDSMQLSKVLEKLRKKRKGRNPKEDESN